MDAVTAHQWLMAGFPSQAMSLPLIMNGIQMPNMSNDARLCASPSYSPAAMVGPPNPLKRRSDVLLPQPADDVSLDITGIPSDPTIATQVLLSEAKRSKFDRQTAGNSTAPAQSKVVHVRNIPSDATESEIVSLGVPFGRVTNVLMLRSKNQAFIELESEEVAAGVVNYYRYVSPVVRQKPVYIQFSTYKELKTENNFTSASSGGDGDQPSHVLRAVIENLNYQVTVEALHEIFSKFGAVLKIITFNKSEQLQALVQFQETASAQAAKLSLDGQNIYNGGCTLHIEYSKLTNLNVRYNNTKSWDYTAAKPSGDDTMGSGTPPAPLDFNQTAGPPTPLMTFPTGLPTNSVPVLPAGFPLSLFAHSNPGLFAPQTSPFPPLGGVFSSPVGLPAFNFQTQSALANLRSLAMTSGGFPQPQGGNIGCVLHVSNLNATRITPDALFTLFGVYGDVHRVKILYAKPDNGLVQMADPTQAQICAKFFNGQTLYDKEMKVVVSKYVSVQMPKEGHPNDTAMTKDYSGSTLHRFKKPGSKNYQNIYQPSSCLHLSNIPDHTTEDDIRKAFEEAGLVVLEFRFFARDHKMALIQLANVEEALHGLISMHNYQLGENQNLRVSFSKSGM